MMSNHVAEYPAPTPHPDISPPFSEVLDSPEGSSSLSSDQILMATDRSNDTPKNQSDKKQRLCSNHQSLVTVAAVFAAVGGLLFGYDTGIISGALLQLRSDFSLTCQRSELVVSSLMIGALVAALVTGPIIDKFGRRNAIVFNSVVFMAGTLIQATAVNFAMLIVGRLIIGFGVSLSATAECIYIAEISPVEKRGFLVSLNEFSIAVGFLVAYVVGYLFINVQNGWRYMFALAVIPALVQCVGMALMPQSPRFLILKGRENKAKTVLKRIRKESAVDLELRQIERSINAEKDLGYRELFSLKDNMLGRLLIGIGLVLLQQVTGQPNVLYYAPMMFEMLGASSASAATLSTVGLGIIKVIFTGIALFVLDRFGRQKALIGGGTLMFIGMLSVGITSLISHGALNVIDPCLPVNLNATPYDPGRNGSSALNDVSQLEPDLGNMWKSAEIKLERNLSAIHEEESQMKSAEAWITLVAFMVFVAGYAVGYGPGTWLILSEIFPACIRGRALSLAIIFNWLSNLLISLTFLQVMSSIGASTTFLMYAAACLISIFYIVCFVPETKDRTLEEITATLQQWTFRKRLKEGLCCRKPPINPDYQPLEVEMSAPWIPSVR